MAREQPRHVILSGTSLVVTRLAWVIESRWDFVLLVLVSMVCGLVLLVAFVLVDWLLLGWGSMIGTLVALRDCSEGTLSVRLVLASGLVKKAVLGIVVDCLSLQVRLADFSMSVGDRKVELQEAAR